MVHPIRQIICTEDNLLRKCIYPVLEMIYFCCFPRALPEDGAPSMIFKVCFRETFLSNLSSTSVLLRHPMYVSNLKNCNAVQSEQRTISIQEGTQALQTISGYKLPSDDKPSENNSTLFSNIFSYKHPHLW